MITTEQDINKKIAAAERAEDVLRYLDHLDSYNEDTRWTVIVAVFRALAGLKDPNLHERGLELSYTLPFQERDWLQDFLIDWANRLPVEQGLSVRARWLSLLEKELHINADAQRLEGAMLMTVSIGSRTIGIERSLERLAGISGPPDERSTVQDQAICTLAWLGYPTEDVLVACLQQRLASEDRNLYWLLMPVRLWTPHALISTIIDLYQNHRDENGNYSSLLWVLADLAQAYPDKADKIWMVVEEGATEFSIRMIDEAGSVSSQINSHHVVDFFLRQIQFPDSEGGVSRGVKHPHWSLYNRMLNLSCPCQLEAYRQSALRASERVIDGIKQDACQDTNDATNWFSEKTRLKKMAWDIALRLDLDGIMDWFPQALVETSSDACGAIAIMAGFVRATSATEALSNIVGNLHTQVSLGVTAIRTLGYIGTPQAFAALMKSQITVDGYDVPQALPDAMASATLLMNDCGPLIRQIGNMALAPLTRMACAAALEQVAYAQPPLAESCKPQILSLLAQPDELPSRMASYLIGALDFLAASDEGTQVLLRAAKGTGEEAARALESLARWDRLADHEDLLTKLGLKRDGESWTLQNQLDQRGTFTVGLLYCTRPHQFSPAVVAILKATSYMQAVQVIWLLQRIPSGSLTSEVEEALFERVRGEHALRRTETEALDTLSTVAPERFALELNYSVCSRWYAQGREAVVSCLRGIRKPENAQIAAIETLRRFLSDPVPSVRRKAARALCDQNPSVLQQEAKRLLASAHAQERECGIGAACWIEDEQAYLILYTIGRQDREKLVRYAARDGRDERRERMLAYRYADKVFADSNEVLGVWHYGQALRDYGDDETTRRLEAAAQNPHFAPNKRAWMHWIAEGVNRRWDERERKRSKS